MGYVQVELPDDLKDIIDRQVAAGHAASDASFLLEAARWYAEEIESEAEDEVFMNVEEVRAIVARADADVAAGRYITISSPADAEAFFEASMERVRKNLGL